MCELSVKERFLLSSYKYLHVMQMRVSVFL